jgi:hypothetical protein
MPVPPVRVSRWPLMVSLALLSLLPAACLAVLALLVIEQRSTEGPNGMQDLAAAATVGLLVISCGMGAIVGMITWRFGGRLVKDPTVASSPVLLAWWIPTLLLAGLSLWPLALVPGLGAGCWTFVAIQARRKARAARD